ncbi:MAG: dihydropteroate synthase [Actinobacteria bacterium]|nr:dihydropteroate synthase [Actinomycetota bacterium]
MIEIGKWTLIVGERINPTGRKKLTEELREGKLDTVIADARAQAEAGAEIIDVNIGAPGVDESSLLPRAARAVYEETGLPVCVDSSDVEALKVALAVLPGEDTLVNSVTGDEEMMKVLLPTVAESGAFVVGLTKDRSGIPRTVEERMAVGRRIIEAAERYGIGRERILLDFLTLPAATDSEAALAALACIDKASREWGVGTILGASNVSFGMPERRVINAAFLAMAISRGLTAALVNPLEEGVVQAILAADMLVGRDPMGRRFLVDYRRRKARGSS